MEKSAGIRYHRNKFEVNFAGNYLGRFDSFDEAYKVRQEAIQSYQHKFSVKRCSFCGDEFSPRGTNRKYCSEKCRFMSLVDTTPGYGPKGQCWRWLGTKHGKGYGHFKVGTKCEKAHRISVKLFKGIDIGYLQGCHTCDLPDCVNPDHIFLGTDEDNKNDRQTKMRHAHGERHARAVTEEKVIRIRDFELGSHAEIAERYGVSKSVVSSIKCGRTWRHLLPVSQRSN
jgi:hypothetical protein